MTEGNGATQPAGPLIGFAFEVKNRSLGFEGFGTPHEVLEMVRKRGLDFKTSVNHVDTGIKSVEVFKVAPTIEFSGGPHAETIMKVLEALDGSDAKRVSTVAASDPGALRSDDESAAVPLLAALSSRNVEAVRALLGAGAGVDRSDQLGMTPLHWAAALGEVDMAATLLEAGADAQRLSRFFVTPGELASLNSNSEVERIIKRFGVQRSTPFSIKLVLSRMASA